MRPRQGALLLVLLGVLVGAVGAVVAAAGLGGRAGEAAAALLRLAALVPVVAVLRRRARRESVEQPVWQRFATAGWIVLGCAALAVAGPLVSGATAVVVAVLAVAGPLVTCLFWYQGLLVWNRVTTSLADPGDRLNGISALCVVVALGDVAVQLLAPHGWNGWSWWQLQGWLLSVGAMVILLGTLASVATIAGLGRDPRAWLIGGQLVLALTAVVATGATGGSTGAGAVAAALGPPAACLLACAALAPEAQVAPQPATTQAVTIGALVVALVAVAVLVVCSRLLPSETTAPVVLASLALVGVSFRVRNLVRDLTQLAGTRRLALTDDLTDLPNRRAFTARLEALQGPARVTVLALDLDRFTEVNDRFGRAAGDELLREVASVFAAALPRGGLLARLGADEFAVLLVGVPAQEAAATAERLVQATLAVSRLDPRPVHLGLSVGLATTGGGAVDGGPAAGGAVDGAGGRADGEELLRRADVALQLARAAGGRVAVYDDAVDRAGRARADLVEDLLAALGDDDDAATAFVVHYQPQVQVGTGAVLGVEALVRWQHPRLGLLAPAAFLDLVEERGLMEALTRSVLRQSAAQAALWRAGGTPLRVSVNLSVSCLGSPSLLGLLGELVAEGLPPAALVLEVTETTLMEDPDTALRTCRDLVGRGFGLSIDDYGTGYSSLAHLGGLPATELKIDRTFVQRVGDPRIAAIIAGTVDLGHALGMSVVAEGVEEPEQLVALERLGCDEVQGYLHSRPLPADQLTAWVRARRVTPVGSTA